MSSRSHSHVPPPSKRLRRGLLAICVCLIIYGSLFPFHGWRTPGDFSQLVSAAALKDVSRSDILANILFYMPFGFLAGLRRPLRATVAIVLAALMLSLSLETLQAFIPGRVASWLDVITNVCGAGLGALLAMCSIFGLRAPLGVSRLTLAGYLRNDRAAGLGIAALLAWGAAQLMPFVPSLDISHLKSALKPLWHMLQGTRPIEPWRCVAYVAATTTLTITGFGILQHTRWRRLAPFYLLALLPLKALMMERQLSPEDLVGTLFGVTLAAALWSVHTRVARLMAALLVPICVLVQALHPAIADTTTYAFNWIPLHAQLTHPLGAMANLADTIWPAMALASLCGKPRARALWYALVPWALFLLTAEGLQQWVPGRHPDITPVLFGAAAWALAAIYAGHPPYRKRD
ncbi:VanZ family protein [Oleiagrimonas sp. C23AA]|uniref:VanZ family protein n=1 Tax=Oleiagrimonas sp. C23AA TaxID=2719047 RepID=UPI0014226299|nr:VanZ family protein [Oleiagrimonas sp. C23AA]NII11151.1 VanZ family protein [Oleiagrimonas sp. C23AA]